VKHDKPFIDPMKDIGPDLFDIEKPARYVGGEVGSWPISRNTDSKLKIALCFPDLYEIGMSNNAIRILYNALGSISSSILCERVFTPAPDFEALLRRLSLPLYTLESGIPLYDCDLVCFSIGYELLATNILTILDVGGIPLIARDRRDNDPIVIAGGPASTNPLPLSVFLDAVYIGEAEAGFYSLIEQISDLKKNGKGRKEILGLIEKSPNIWLPERLGKAEKRAHRAIFSNFSTTTVKTTFPLPVISTVQSHGTVEIMRGCPNGCRFCHAGFFYRPQRVKTYDSIRKEVANLVEKGGYREITLASLSSGDYPDILGLVRKLNSEWSTSGVSFQLPSLKVDSFTLPLLESLSEVRKSGLTFAVETPIESWQATINKSVSFEKVSQILTQAKKAGFRLAKFYFMIGLPVPEQGRGEALAIADFLKRISRVERIDIHVNIGTFVPKPHTPFQRERQLSERNAFEAIGIIKDELRLFKNIKISWHSAFVSTLEGILSRGDERVSDLILSAYKKGARLDAWDEYLNVDIWREVFEEAKTLRNYNPVEVFLSEIPSTKKLPWHNIDVHVSSSYLKQEKVNATASSYTSICNDSCTHPCGSCTKSRGIVNKDIHAEPDTSNKTIEVSEEKFATPLTFACDGTESDSRLVVIFKKEDKAVLYPLHSIHNLFSRALSIIKVPLRFTNGFNPIPKMELLPPLPLGISSNSEILATWAIFDEKWWQDSVEFKLYLVAELNSVLPEGIRVNDIFKGRSRKEGKRSIGSFYRSSRYEIIGLNDIIQLIYSQFSNGVLEGISEVMLYDDEETLKKLSFVLMDYKGGKSSLMNILERVLLKKNSIEAIDANFQNQNQLQLRSDILHRLRIARTACYGEDQKLGIRLLLLQELL
jgi:radical SAM family uncharacterized protein